MRKSLPFLLVPFLFHYEQRRYNSIVVIKRILRDREGLKGAKTKAAGAGWHWGWQKQADRQSGGCTGRGSWQCFNLRCGADESARADSIYIRWSGKRLTWPMSNAPPPGRLAGPFDVISKPGLGPQPSGQPGREVRVVLWSTPSSWRTHTQSLTHTQSNTQTPIEIYEGCLPDVPTCMKLPICNQVPYV